MSPVKYDRARVSPQEAASFKLQRKDAVNDSVPDLESPMQLMIPAHVPY